MRSKRKTLCLCVNANSEILVRAPFNTGERKIKEFVEKHESWIRRRLDEYAARKKLFLRNGDVVVLFGKEYSVKEGSAAVSGKEIYLPSENRAAAFERLLKRLTEIYMTALTEEIASRYAFRYSKIRVSSARLRWGSCNKKGVISYTFYLAFTKEDICRYVAVHELCHTRVFDHGKRFWKEVEYILPDWRELRARLRKEEAVFAYLDGHQG